MGNASDSTASSPPEISPDYQLRRPLRAFGRWWAYWAFFPLADLLPDSGFTIAFWWLVGVPLFFWTGLRPMRLWMHSPTPAWLFFVLWMGVPFLMLLLTGAGLRMLGLLTDSCCGPAQ